jgi:NADH dehydrogenase FAD-containing subunit
MVRHLPKGARLEDLHNHRTGNIGTALPSEAPMATMADLAAWCGATGRHTREDHAMTSEKVTAVVLGGGIGGQVAATRLRQRLGNDSRVVLVERSPDFTFAPSLLWLMVGDRAARTITRDYSRLRRRGVEVVQAAATAIDSENSVVQTDAGPIAYDHLVVALGATLDPDRIPGLRDLTHHPYTLESAMSR